MEDRLGEGGGDDLFSGTCKTEVKYRGLRYMETTTVDRGSGGISRALSDRMESAFCSRQMICELNSHLTEVPSYIRTRPISL